MAFTEYIFYETQLLTSIIFRATRLNCNQIYY